MRPSSHAGQRPVQHLELRVDMTGHGWQELVYIL